jgi:hypothetical protein
MHRSKQLRYDTNSLAILFFASHSFALRRSIACVISSVCRRRYS